MKHFVDFEFLENGETIVPISIGIASEDFAEYYAVFSEIQTDEKLHRRISEHDFLAKHVIKHLPLTDDRRVAEQLTRAAQIKREVYFQPNTDDYSHNAVRLDWELDLTDPDVKPKWVIANEVRKYFLDRLDHGLNGPSQDAVGEVELWANYGAYDHVCLMQLWGPMVARPKHLPMFTHDLQHFAHDLGVSRKDFPKQEAAEHDALADARHDWDIWKFLDAQRVRQQVGEDDLASRIASIRRAARDAGREPPGRGALAEELGATPHQVRVVLEKLAARSASSGQEV